MRRQLVIGALALSVLFNVFFVAGYVKARAQRARAVEIEDVVARELELDGDQVAVFADLRRTGRQDAEVYQDDLALVREELAEEIDRADDGDPQRLAEIVEREAELRRQWRLSEVDRLGEFVGALTPEQRRRLAARLKHEGAPEGRRQAMRERFDANGDGVLDDDERAAAREFLQERRAEHERHRRDGRPDRERRFRIEIVRRFDADGDGRLDADEMRAVRRWLAAD